MSGTSRGRGRAAGSSTHGSGIGLTVTSAASAFFSGEKLEFTITFTNTRPSNSSSQSLHESNGNTLRSSKGHKSSYSASAYSAPPSRSTFSPLSPEDPGPSSLSRVVSPAPNALNKSYIDPGNSTAGSTHIVLPERQGIIGTPLALSSSIVPSRSISPINAKRPIHAPNPQRSAPPHQTLYSQKRVPTVPSHKKNDYSVALSYPENGNLYAEGDQEEGVSDLSSQLAGMALLQERGSSIESAEDSPIDAQSYVEQYRQKGESLNGQFAGGSSRVPSGISTISEEGSNDTPQRRVTPMRSISASSIVTNTTVGSRVPSAASTAFEALDHVNGTRNGIDFYGIGRNESVDSVLRDSMTTYAARGMPGQRIPSRSSLPPLQNAHGRSFSTASTPSINSAPLRSLTPSSSVDDEEGTETLLWAFAQFTGAFTIDESLVKNGEFLAVKRALFGGQKNPMNPTSGGERVIGGGSLDSESITKSSGSGWRDWIWGTSNANENDRRPSTTGQPGSSLPVDPAVDGTLRRRSSAAVVSGMPSSTPSVGSLEDRRNKAMNDASVPVFSSPPSILAVDLILEPGESKTYKFSLQLPGDLPPSFRGKAISFNYTFIVGTNRAPNLSRGEVKQQSRLVKVPVRIYNHVSMTGVRPFYDLTNPIIWYRDEAKVAAQDDSTPPNAALARRRQRSGSISLEAAHAAARKQEEKRDFQEYARTLLESTFLSPAGSPEIATTPKPPLSSPLASEGTPSVTGSPFYDDGGPAARPELMKRTTSMGSALIMRNRVLGDLGEETTCKSAVEIVSRNAQKVSYDINKDGYRIAILTLVKSAYRLGDTVNVMITLNVGDARVLRLAARLETHELVETTVSVKSTAQVRQLTRRLHAEHHETTLDSGRVGFALAIPSGATPDFATSGVKLQWSLRVSFLILPPQDPKGVFGLGTRTPPMPSKASVPNSPSPAAYHHQKSKSYAFGGTSGPGTPVPVETGTHHLLPVPSVSAQQQYTSYRAVPDLSFVPTLFQSPSAQSLAQRQHNELASPILGGPPKGSQPEEAVVLMPTKIETVEISIPLRVYPSATPFRAPVATFTV